MPEVRAQLFRENSIKHNIELSIHAPYYIAIGADDPQKIENSINELKKAIHLASVIGARKVVFHPGASYGDRKAATTRSIKALHRLGKEIEMKNIVVCPEIAGKVNQLGSLEEVLEICSKIEYAWPCLDLAHLHAREHGSLNSKEAFARVFDKAYETLGDGFTDNLHFHLYPIKWGAKGEVCHKAFDDRKKQVSLFDENEYYLPRFEPIVEYIYENNLCPTIICEAKDSQDVGALAMKQYYLKLTSGSMG